jgi:hypothetical protein
MQLIFDESQRQGDHEIWIDTYALCKLLDRHRSETVKNPETKEYARRHRFEEIQVTDSPAPEAQDAGLAPSL